MRLQRRRCILPPARPVLYPPPEPATRNPPEAPMKVLIIHASAGAGHKSAAQAIEKAYRTLAEQPEVRILDALDFAPAWFKRIYQGSFESSVKHAPWAFGAAYHVSSQAVRFQDARGMRR